MQSAGSLLAHLSPRFTERTEDVAVEALGYILSTSEAARRALLGICKAGGAEVAQLSRIATQVGGDGGERPDLVGWDENGDERLLIEAKFWAGLTGNQPHAYLERLPPGGTLLFVAPEARIDTLWPELERLVRKGGLDWTPSTDSPRSADVTGKRLILTTWKALLDEAVHGTIASGDDAAVASLRQLDGLCQGEDQEAFLPLKQHELGPELPRRLLNLASLVDHVVNRAKAEGLVSTKGLTAAATRRGYRRWIRLGVRRNGSWANDRSVVARLGLDYEAWYRHRETPLWLYLHRSRGLEMNELGKRLAGEVLAGTRSVPICLPTGVELDDVVDSVVDQLRELAHRIAGAATD